MNRHELQPEDNSNPILGPIAPGNNNSELQPSDIQTIHEPVMKRLGRNLALGAFLSYAAINAPEIIGSIPGSNVEDTATDKRQTHEYETELDIFTAFVIIGLVHVHDKRKRT